MGMAMAIGAIVGGVSAATKANEQAANQEEQIRLQRQGAMANYNSSESSANIMKAVNREQTANAIQESLRSGSEDQRRMSQKIDKTASTASAKSEGLTSGRSKGREMIGIYMEGNKMMRDTKDETTSQIAQLVDANDKATNDLNNQLFKAYQDMSSVLASEGPSINVMAQVTEGVVGGAGVGQSMGSSISANNASKGGRV